MMKKTEYIEIRRDYSRKAKERSNTMAQLNRECSELNTRTEELQSELDSATQLYSNVENDISRNKENLTFLMNCNKEIDVLDDKLNKAWDELRIFETTGKDLVNIMSSFGKQKMTELIDDWLQFCTILFNQTR